MKDSFVLSGSGSSFLLRVGRGTVIENGETVRQFPGGTVALSANATSYIYITLATSAITASTTASPANGLLVGVVVTGPVGITSIAQGTVDEDDAPTTIVDTAGDLQDLSSYGLSSNTVAERVRVIRDENGNPLPGGRWYSKQTADTRSANGVTIVLPIDCADPGAGRWVLEGYEA